MSLQKRSTVRYQRHFLKTWIVNRKLQEKEKGSMKIVDGKIKTKGTLFYEEARRKRNGNHVAIARVSDLLKWGVDQEWLAREYVRINCEVWGCLTESVYIWTLEKARRHFETCPEILYCLFLNGKLVGTLTNMFTTEQDLCDKKTWLEKTANGTLECHRPNGKLAFGVDLSITKEAERKGLGTRMVLAALLVTLIGEGKKAAYLGARIPAYHRQNGMSVDDYVFGVRTNRKPLDPEVYFYMKSGFEIVEIIPGYMEDPQSRDFGVLMKWENPFYRITEKFPFLKSLVRQIGTRLFLSRI